MEVGRIYGPTSRDEADLLRGAVDIFNAMGVSGTGAGEYWAEFDDSLPYDESNPALETFVRMRVLGGNHMREHMDIDECWQAIQDARDYLAARDSAPDDRRRILAHSIVDFSA